MKLRLRAEAKDWKIFGIFCGVLLYLVCIAVTNIGSYLNYGYFSGLNPFPAFTSEYLGITLLLFVAAMVAVFSGVSSMIFERKKGIGFEASEKEDKGYARWAKEAEFKKQLKKVDPKSPTSDVAGIPLINNGKEVWVDAGEYHNLIIGSTGSGKTEMIVQPMVRILAKCGESMIITDPKGEIYEKNANALREKGYNIVLLNFRDPQKGNAWNPLSLPYKLYKSGNIDKACELLDDLALNILYDESSKNSDPFWEKTSADYFAGLALALFEDATEDQINLNSINLMTTVGEEKFMGSTYVKAYFDTKDPASSAYVNVSSTIMAPSDTKGSILSVFKQKIKLFASRENLSEMLGHNDFDMKDIGRKKTAVFIVVQDEKKTYHPLVTIFLKQCYETLIDVAQDSGRKLPFKTNFILDEFANMPPLKDVDTMVSAARSRRIRFTFIIQNFAQLNQVYSKEIAETIKGNCGNIIYLISSELTALEEISKMCGELKSKEKDKTDSRPLVTVSDLQRLPQWTMIVLRIRNMPFKTRMTPDFKMNNNNMWDRKLDTADYPLRDKQPVGLFDIKDYVQKAHEKKMKDLLGDNAAGEASANPMASLFGGNAPFPGGGAIPNPFGNKPSEAPKPGGNLGFNVDDLVKRIDEKIAALEEEERLEKEKNNQENTDNTSVKEDKIIDDLDKDTPKTNDTSINKDITKNDNNTKVNTSIDGITDDEFFDDFFNDED